MRTALSLRQPELANRLADGVEPRTPLAEHALCAARAQLAEAAEQHMRGRSPVRRRGRAMAAFGNVPERAYALLGQGRCLSTDGNTSAASLLLEARELFAAMGFAPAVAEIDSYLGPAEAAAL